jgi:hypothetical protein
MEADRESFAEFLCVLSSFPVLVAVLYVLLLLSSAAEEFSAECFLELALLSLFCLWLRDSADVDEFRAEYFFSVDALSLIYCP